MKRNRLIHDFILLTALLVASAFTSNQPAALASKARSDYQSSRSMDLTDQFFFNGYHTVLAHYQHMDDVARDHPDLVRLVTYGMSWRKTNGKSDGYDLRAICITKLRPGDCELDPNTNKPRFLMIAGIHSREITTPELAWMWIDKLVNGYGGFASDPEVISLLDYSEMWVIPIANPDGSAMVEKGGDQPYFQRKNANTSLGNCRTASRVGSGELPDVSQSGVDLNRNFSWTWGLGGVISNDPCHVNYLGVGAASEPEVSSLQNLFRLLFQDQRGPAWSDAAPLSTNGLMISLHSTGNDVMFPWGTGGKAPNDRELRTLAHRLSYRPGWPELYATGRPSEIYYDVSGSMDDQLYGDLGIPSFTFEIGENKDYEENVPSGPCSGFMPPVGCVITFFNLNEDAFMYAAKSARQGYATSQGPVASYALAEPGMVRFFMNDAAYGYSPKDREHPSSQIIAAAEYYVDAPPWAGGVPCAMTAEDGAFDEVTEVVSANLVAGLSNGRHLVYGRGRDIEGNWGPVMTDFVFIDSNTPQNGSCIPPAVPPSANINLSAATLINGMPTFFARAGSPIDFSGNATDPDSDNLVLHWDWGDSSPLNKITYLVNPSKADSLSSSSSETLGMVDSQTHTFELPNLYTIKFWAEDDTGAVSPVQSAVVIVTANVDTDRTRSTEYWRHQFRQEGKTDFDEDTLLRYLAITDFLSSDFNQVRDASTVAAALDVLLMQQEGDDTRERLDRELLTAWLNFANGAIEYHELLDIKADDDSDNTFAELVKQAELVRLDSSATRAEIREQKNILHHINH